jgi:hypothetical protein
MALCRCGCRRTTSVAPFNWKKYGWVKGEPLAFIHGHNRIRHGEWRGRVKTPEYRSFHAAKRRCQSKKDVGYPYYGGRGILFLFQSFEQFLAEVGRRPSRRFTLDRIQNDGHYEPGNVRWATRKQQMANKRKRGTCGVR